jgi:hypothetical protein
MKNKTIEALAIVLCLGMAWAWRLHAVQAQQGGAALEPAGAAAGAWEYKFGALQYAMDENVKNVFFVELPVEGQTEVKVVKFSDMAAAGWELVGPANLYDVNVFDSQKLLAATALRRAR